MSKIAPAYAATRTLQEVVYSEAYRTRLAAAQLRSLDHWTSLSATMRSELSSIIGRAVIDGKNPRVVRREIAERLGVSMSRAAQYAQTEITGALRDARAAEADQAAGHRAAVDIGPDPNNAALARKPERQDVQHAGGARVLLRAREQVQLQMRDDRGNP